LRRFRPGMRHGPNAAAVLPIDVFETEACVIAIFPDRRPREYANLGDMLRALGLREGDLVEVPPSRKIQAVGP
jgi:hypothetical protein